MTSASLWSCRWRLGRRNEETLFIATMVVPAPRTVFCEYLGGTVSQHRLDCFAKVYLFESRGRSEEFVCPRRHPRFKSAFTQYGGALAEARERLLARQGECSGPQLAHAYGIGDLSCLLVRGVEYV